MKEKINLLIHSGKEKLRDRWQEEDGSAVLEVVIVIAVVLAIALIFNSQIRTYANNLFDTVFNDSSVIEAIG